jgi:hypothetical protein
MSLAILALNPILSSSDGACRTCWMSSSILARRATRAWLAKAEEEGEEVVSLEEDIVEQCSGGWCRAGMGEGAIGSNK